MSGGKVEQGGGAQLGPPPAEVLHLHDLARDQVLVMEQSLDTVVGVEQSLDIGW